MAGSFLRSFRRRGGAPVRDESVPRPPDRLILTGLGPTVRVETDFGPVPAMLLRPRDRLRTQGGGFVSLKAVQRITFDARCLAAHPEAGPITIPEGVLGMGLPRQPIELAPQQLIAATLGKTGECCVPAEHCVGLSGVTRNSVAETVYHQLVCEGIADILAEGVAVRATLAA